MRLNQAIRNLNSGDLEISLVVVVTRLGVTGLRRTWVVYLLNYLGGRG